MYLQQRRVGCFLAIAPICAFRAPYYSRKLVVNDPKVPRRCPFLTRQGVPLESPAIRCFTPRRLFERHLGGTCSPSSGQTLLRVFGRAVRCLNAIKQYTVYYKL